MPFLHRGAGFSIRGDVLAQCDIHGGSASRILIIVLEGLANSPEDFPVSVSDPLWELL